MGGIWCEYEEFIVRGRTKTARGARIWVIEVHEGSFESVRDAIRGSSDASLEIDRDEAFRLMVYPRASVKEALKSLGRGGLGKLFCRWSTRFSIMKSARPFEDESFDN